MTSAAVDTGPARTCLRTSHFRRFLSSHAVTRLHRRSGRPSVEVRNGVVRVRRYLQLTIGTLLALLPAAPALAQAPEHFEGVFPVLNGPGPVDCRSLGYDFDVKQTGALTFFGTRRADGTSIRHATLETTVYRADDPSRTLELRGRYQQVDSAGTRRLVGLVRFYTEDSAGKPVLRRVGHEIIDTSTRPPSPVFATPFAGPAGEAAAICAALA